MTQVDSAKPIAAAHRRLAALGASAAALLTIGAALIGWSLFNGAGAVRLGPNGAVELAFRGCDARGRCGDFVLFAPGYDFRWNFGKDSRQAAERPTPRLKEALAPHLVEARMVIAAGLSSNEGDESVNRRLAACRSKRLAHLIDDAQFDLRTSAPVYRLSLGRYAPEPGALVEESAIERLMLIGFLRRADRDMDLDAALKDGVAGALPSALDQLPDPVARQLDLTRYSCWREEFAVTPDAAIRTACFAEPAADTESFCADF